MNLVDLYNITKTYKITESFSVRSFSYYAINLSFIPTEVLEITVNGDPVIEDLYSLDLSMGQINLYDLYNIFDDDEFVTVKVKYQYKLVSR